MTVEAFLDGATRRRWQWGVLDCSLFCADAAMVVSGRDPGKGIRGTYSTEAEAMAIVAAAGGMEAFIGARLEAIGWRRWSYRDGPWRDFDIGVIDCPAGALGLRTATPAIWWAEKRRWIARTPVGLISGKFMHKAVWRFDA